MDYIKITTGLFVILNPFVLIPVFISLTGEMNKRQRMKIAMTTASSVFIIMAIAIFGGKYVLVFFGITVNDFRIAGGVLIFLMALSMARAKEESERYSEKEHESAKSKTMLDNTNIAVVPLSIPLMAGPASISLAIIDGALCDTIALKTILVGIIFGLSIILWISMALADFLGGLLGHNGIKVLTRVMGLILLALSVEFLITGISVAFGLSP